MELDHIFLFVDGEPKAREMMAAAGLTVNYSRVHPGQGTTNLCACLEDVFLELLWRDGSPVSDESERVTLGARGRGEGSPIGIAWRGPSHIEARDDGVTPYAAPFLPDGMTIPVAVQSLDAGLPFVFRTPGGVPPSQRGGDLVGNRQLPIYAGVQDCAISTPRVDEVRRLCASLDALRFEEGQPGLRFTLTDPDGHPVRDVVWTV